MILGYEDGYWFAVTCDVDTLAALRLIHEPR
jgi:hypothetical protein